MLQKIDLQPKSEKVVKSINFINGHEVPDVVVRSLPIALLKCLETLAVKATLQSEGKNSIHSLHYGFKCHKTKTKLISYQLDYSANLKP